MNRQGALPRPVVSHRLAWALAISLLLHLAIAGTGLEWPNLLHRAVPPPPEELASVEVVMGTGAEASQPLQVPPPAPPDADSKDKPQPAPPPAKPEAKSEAQPEPKPAPQPAAPPPPPPEKDATALPAPPPQPVAPPVAQPTPPPAPQPAPEATKTAPDQPEFAPPKVWQKVPLMEGGLEGAIGLAGRARPAMGDKRNLPPVYPPLSAQLGEQGTVVLRLYIGADGQVHASDILTTSGYSRLDAAARDAAAKWRFTPAVRDGQPIPSEFDLTLHFALD